MNPFSNFIKAVKKLQGRNQSYVNRNGVNSYSSESDWIIKQLVNFHNHAEKLQEKLTTVETESMSEVKKLQDTINKLRLLLQLYDIPKEFENYPLPFIETMIEHRDSIKKLIHPQTLKEQYTTLKTYIQWHLETLQYYQQYMLQDQPELCQSLKNTWQHIQSYFQKIDKNPAIDINTFYPELLKDLYNGKLRA